ncbi:uncharacterized protein LOC125302016 isoform X1 [Alosa alosa]|uniref:uncharacterized protein LOC125302016 isoform X1 n=1 Tax=Alosa alosa TaxID=278164 RepID=UPI0020150E37|nr:uncharacterized protein LOC125302016 isoform X1 [Alosa alosa]
MQSQAPALSSSGLNTLLCDGLQMQEEDSLGKVGDAMEEMFSISSVSPCPEEDPPLDPATRAGETTKLPACLSQENILPLHVSPLEAIRELDEAEEALSGLRSPGDGAVRARDQLVTKESPLHSTERETDDLACEDCEEDDTLHVTVKTLRSIIISEDRINLETPLTETCASPHDISDLGCLREDSRKHTSQKLLGSGGAHQGMLGTNSSLERTIVIIGSELNDTGSSVTSLQDLKEKHRHANMGVTIGSGVLRNSTGTIANLEENICEDQMQEDVSIRKRDSTACNSTLIDILTACKTKVEQLEQLKCSSFELTVQLQSAQAMAAHLLQQVEVLERERGSRQREMLGLQEQLQEARRALQETRAQTALLHLQLGSSEVQQQQRQRQSPNGHAHVPTAGPDHGPSRVCTLL